MTITTPKKITILALLIAIPILIDQVIKHLVLLCLPLREPTQSLLGFRLNHTRNTGAAFSFLDEHPAILAVVVSLILIGCVVYLFADEKKRPFSQSVCLALICAGGLGNLIDRLRLGYVLDYIEPVFIRFAIFNFADMVLCCAVAAWAFLLIRDARKRD